ncbi:carbohydrate ABC transporter permease [Ruania alkalisoli]|uniref:Carbohydrate ABC transporter permease n=1 Tax=Ruania alkalisoli TaxID=2779775 RepID=A0A7M1SXN4_9MICO|nr:carbohydrate ABC transporter permease [Ruania alkalisoli]QOR71492.1 carbohydrate ABC transporter permease [Ruania alkalisoli]
MTELTAPRTARSTWRAITQKLGSDAVYTEELTGTPATRFLRHVVLLGLGLFMMYPLLWMLSASFKPSGDVFSDTGLIPAATDWSNYGTGWNALEHGFQLYLFNSLLLAVANIVGNVFSCSITAYVFARLRFRGRRMMFALTLGTMLLPSHVVLIPQYVVFSKLGWINTYLPLIVPAFLATNAFFVFLLVQFMRALPMELQDAAKIDGCGAIRTYWSVIMPLTVPALATVSIFTFIASWNEFFGPLLYLTDQELFTVPLALRQFIAAEGSSAWGPMFAMSVLSLLPVIGFFFIGQRYLINGIATTGMK